MRYDLKEILEIGEQGGFAIPAFNVYNLETVLGIMNAAEETGAPVIFQMYSRLFDSQVAQYVSPIILEAMHNMKTPVAFHLDHGAGVPEVLRAFRYGATGVMIDASKKSIDENIAITKGVVDMAKEMGITVEGELGEVGSAKDGVSTDYTKVEDAVKYVEGTGVTLCLENLPSIATTRTAQSLLHFISDAGDKNLAICLDTGHLHLNNARGDTNQTHGDFIRTAGDYLQALHIVDNNGLGDTHQMPFSARTGVDWKDVMQGLRDIDYKGLFNLEILGERGGNPAIKAAKLAFIKTMCEEMLSDAFVK